MAHYISYDRISSYQLMWILIMFDLPTETKQQRKAASEFRKYLISDRVHHVPVFHICKELRVA